MTKKARVIIMRCDDYDADLISRIVSDGMRHLDVRPQGRVLIKPNTVIAHPRLFPHAFTRKEFLEGVIMAINAISGLVSGSTSGSTSGPISGPISGPTSRLITELAVGERCGITIPTRFAFKHAGYGPVLRRHRVKTYYFEETAQVPVAVSRQMMTHRDHVMVPKPVADCEFFINLPKFKAHPWTRLTLGLKNYIGIQDDRYRLIDHNQFLEHKIADLQQVIQPKFIAIDAISAGQRMMLTPTPFPMGAIVMGTNACAVDAVGCHMVNVDPVEIPHIRFASERGIGPIDLADIAVEGDFPLSEIQEKNRTFEFYLKHIDHSFGSNANLQCTVGTFPEKYSPDYCWGGCPGALQEAVHILKAYSPDVLHRMGKIRYVVGNVAGPLDVAPDETVLFVGDCTRWRGKIDGMPVHIKSTYGRQKKRNNHRPPSNDMLLKNMKTIANCMANRRKRVIRVPGCPVSVADHVHYLSFFGGVTNPNFDRRMVVDVNMQYMKMTAGRIKNRLFQD
ncbi:MAG: DUF362 domain-containing protein [Desulfobacteraceae bacterium]|nr:DUF362 domain-containing protein [Desulfobacteraceae bacterium]